MNKELPEGWISSNLKDIGKIVSGGTPSTSESAYWGNDVPWITPADLSGYNEKYIARGRKSISQLGLKKSSARILPKGSVLFSSRAPIGYVVIASNDLTTNQGFKSIIPNSDIDSNYLYYYLKSKKQLAEDNANGTTFKEISGKSFSELPFKYPLIVHQRKIVQKIEELFSELDKGIENLKTAQQQLKVYRQAVLKWAFEGKLTNENVTDKGLPKGWEWRKIADVVTLLGDGLHGTPHYNENGPYFFINGNNLIDGKITIKPNTKKVSVEEYNKYWKNLNDKTILVSINGTIGNIAFYNGEKVVLGKSACYLNVKESINKHYLAHLLKGQRFQNYAVNSATGSTIKNVSLKSMRDFDFPLPPKNEQELIIDQIESRLSVCDKIEETILVSLQQAEALRQSILKLAFEGKLIKETPDYVPKNTYFYQVQLLGKIAAGSKKRGINHGEMTIAKYAYLVDKLYQVPTYYKYERWHLGPYPPEIKKAITNTKFFNKVNNSIEVKDIDTLTKYSNPYSDKLDSAIDNLSDVFLDYDEKERSHQIELLATVCKVIEDIQSTDLALIRQSMADWKIDLKTTLLKNKAEKFSEEETGDSINLIIEKEWNKKLITK